MADTKLDFQWFDIPDGKGGYERRWCKDAEAREDIGTLRTEVDGYITIAPLSTVDALFPELA